MFKIDSTSVLRFAPSPTGYLHIGNARPALINAILACKFGGKFILRLDDTDTERSTEIFATAIQEDLNWLGIHWDRFERQSTRVARYADALAGLKASGLVYPCYETPDELDRKRKLQQTRGLPPVYDRAALKLSPEAREELEAAGIAPHYRFKLSGNTANWHDGVRGDAHIETSSLSDPVLVRGDGTVLYTFASVVDDIDMGVTHIIRGEDHVANTAVQLELFAALSAKPPQFAHHNLITTTTGEEMSKRKGSLSIRSFKEAGADPMAVVCVAVLTGSSEAVRPFKTMDELAEVFDLAKLSRALTKFDPAEIGALSARLLHEKPFEEVETALNEQGIAGEKARDFWACVHSNLAKIDEAKDWWAIATGTITPVISEPDYISDAIALLPVAPFTDNTWGEWTDALKAKTGRKGKALFMPLRLALTGLEHGPELKLLLPLMGRDLCLKRLGG
jgi:glutamyl-tRNA synthetase